MKGRTRKLQAAWTGPLAATARLHGRLLRVRRIGGGGEVIRWEALVDGRPVGRHFSPLGAKYLAEEAAEDPLLLPAHPALRHMEAQRRAGRVLA